MFLAGITPEMLKLVAGLLKVKLFFLVLVDAFSFS